jgi:hypothetical protein
MKGAIRPSVLKANEPSPAVDVSSSIGTGDESFSVTAPATGAPVAATPETILETAVTGLVPEADPPPLQPESIKASAVSGIAVILNLDLIFFSFVRYSPTYKRTGGLVSICSIFRRPGCLYETLRLSVPSSRMV